MTIAVQAAIGDAGSKPVTELTNFNFNSLAEIGGVPLGASTSGLYKLNVGESESIASFRLATTDLGSPNPKHIRFLYIGLSTLNDLTIRVKLDESNWTAYTLSSKVGLQRVRVPISRKPQGRYITIEVISDKAFQIDSIQAVVYSRSSGLRG